MEVIGLDNLTADLVNKKIQVGGKFVIYQYTFSILVMTYKRTSNIYFVKNGEKALKKGLPYTLISLFLGWWGVPWGPIHTISSIGQNLMGGKDVTENVISLVLQQNEGMKAASVTQ